MRLLLLLLSCCVASLSAQTSSSSVEDRVRAFKEAIARSPNSGQPEFELAEYYYGQASKAAAFEHYRNAVRKGDLKNPVLLHQRVAYLGYELEFFGDALKAVDFLQSTAEGQKDVQLPELRKAIVLRLRENQGPTRR